METVESRNMMRVRNVMRTRVYGLHADAAEVAARLSAALTVF
jgi:hypothetical protein